MQIYSMTIRLSAMFEDHMHRILLNWKSGRRNRDKTHNRDDTHNKKTKAKAKRKPKKKSNLSNGTGKRLLLPRVNVCVMR